MRFEINGKEHELKLTYGSISELNKKYPGGAQEVVGACIQGNLEMFEDAIYFGLMHTGEGVTREKVVEEITNKFEQEKISQQYIEDVLHEVIADNFFYRAKTKQLKAKMKKQLVAKNPELKEMADEMFGMDEEQEISLEKK